MSLGKRSARMRSRAVKFFNLNFSCMKKCGFPAVSRRVSAALAAAALLISPSPAAAEFSYSYSGIYGVDYLPDVGEIVYPTTDHNLRADPDGEIIGTLKAGEPLEILGYDEDSEWAEISGGWCFAGYLSESPPVFSEIKTDGSDGKKLVGFTNSEISDVPSEILDALAECGYEITITDSDLGLDNLYLDGTDCPESTGVTLLSDEVCLSYVEADPFAVRHSAVHEIGHAFCWLLGEPCYSAEFAYCYEEEKEYADTGHHRSDEHEYFASAFRDYLVEGESAFEDRSVTYEFMNEIVTAFVEDRVVIEDDRVIVLEREE